MRTNPILERAWEVQEQIFRLWLRETLWGDAVNRWIRQIGGRV